MAIAKKFNGKSRRLLTYAHLYMMATHYLALIILGLTVCSINGALPIIVNTWGFTEATAKGWETLRGGGSALDAVERGGTVCEQYGHCASSIGYGAHPDEVGETTLDAMIMDGGTHDVGAVGDLRRVKSALSVARAVLNYTTHTFLAGESATNFAKEVGFEVSDLSSNSSLQEFNQWKSNNCQPNYRTNVTPDPKQSCGPYKPLAHVHGNQPRMSEHINADNHDTIGLIAIDSTGNIAGGTTTNGMDHKVPGRVGDSPMVGSGAYVDNLIGGAAGTGDGDVMMRFLPSFQAVSYMEQGFSPSEAARRSLIKIALHYPSFSGAIVALNKAGDHGAACHGFPSFPYSVLSANMKNVSVFTVPCMSGNEVESVDFHTALSRYAQQWITNLFG